MIGKASAGPLQRVCSLKGDLKPRAVCPSSVAGRDQPDCVGCHGGAAPRSGLPLTSQKAI